MEINLVGGGSLPPELLKMLGGGGGDDITMRPARLADLQGLLTGDAQPKLQVGDIVVLREFAKNRFKWPTNDDRCIVTQVLDVPFRGGEPGTALPGRRHDFALAFKDDDGDILEFLHDSRMFERVGSIYDPVTLPNGEVLPTV